MNYFSSTVDYNEDDLDNVCPDIAEGLFAGPVTYVGGEMDPYMQNYYDERSHIDKAFGKWNRHLLGLWDAGLTWTPPSIPRPSRSKLHQNTSMLATMLEA